MAYGRFPDISGQEYDPLWARQMAEQDIPRVPADIQQAPDARLGPLRLNGGGLDSAALAVLNALQNQQMPGGGNFGTGLLTGLAGGLAGGRVRQMQSRQSANSAEQKRVLGDDIERRKQAAAYGRSLAQHRWNMQRDAAKAKDDGLIDVTPEIRKEAADNGIYIHPALTKVNRNQLVRQVQRDVVGERMAGNVDKAEEDAAQLLDGVMSGRLSPIQSELFSSRDTDVRRKFNVLANQKGFNLLEAQRTHLGYKTYYNTLNGRLQLAVRQSVQNAQGGLKLLSELNQQMGSLIPRDSRFTVLNRAALAAAKQGAFGKEARDLAIQMDQQIGNLISELANVYQGGGVPTDEARKQAEANFYGKYAGQRSLEKNIELAMKDVGIRASAIQTVGPLTPGTPSGGSPTPPVPAQPGTPVKETPVVPAKPLGGMFNAVQGTVKKLRGK